jgi:hypothetical protein
VTSTPASNSNRVGGVGVSTPTGVVAHLPLPLTVATVLVVVEGAASISTGVVTRLPLALAFALFVFATLLLLRTKDRVVASLLVRWVVSDPSWSEATLSFPIWNGVVMSICQSLASTAITLPCGDITAEPLKEGGSTVAMSAPCPVGPAACFARLFPSLLSFVFLSLSIELTLLLTSSVVQSSLGSSSLDLSSWWRTIISS